MLESRKGDVLVLGTFHMSGEEGLDADRRQAEIEQLVSKLARFKPTKIAVEMEPEDSDYCNEKYDRYRQGSYDLEMNEIFQVGFRLASKMGHERLFPTDWMGESDLAYGEAEQWGRENQPALLDEIFEGFTIPELSDNKSIIDYYKEINAPDILNMLHKMYVNIARIGKFNHYVGIDWLSWWYKRNLIMFSNLTRLIESDDERILFIVGFSHSSIVTQFLEESGVYGVTDPLAYLS